MRLRLLGKHLDRERPIGKMVGDLQFRGGRQSATLPESADDFEHLLFWERDRRPFDGHFGHCESFSVDHPRRCGEVYIRPPRDAAARRAFCIRAHQMALRPQKLPMAAATSALQAP